MGDHDMAVIGTDGRLRAVAENTDLRAVLGGDRDAETLLCLDPIRCGACLVAWVDACAYVERRPPNPVASQVLERLGATCGPVYGPVAIVVVSRDAEFRAAEMTRVVQEHRRVRGSAELVGPSWALASGATARDHAHRDLRRDPCHLPPSEGGGRVKHHVTTDGGGIIDLGQKREAQHKWHAEPPPTVGAHCPGDPSTVDGGR